MKKKAEIPEFGISVSYTVMGEGEPVMLVHGLCESGKIWRHHAELLSERYRVIIPDLPGYGESTPFPDGNFALEKISRVLFSLADREGINRFTIIGHSMGGYAGLAMAEEQPERIRALSLFHSTTRGDSDEKRNARERSVKVFLQNRELFFRELFKNLFHTGRLEEFMPRVNELLNDSASISTETVKGTLLALRDRKDRFELTKHFKGRLSYFIGRHDNVLPAEALKAEAEELGAHIHISENAGHMGFYECPEETAEYLFRFLIER
jgi:pimeloyl-ACP methyl ester carboxylesterase